MTRMGRATEKGLDEVSKAVLGPVFHAEGALTQKVFVGSLHPARVPHTQRYARHPASDGMLQSR